MERDETLEDLSLLTAGKLNTTFHMLVDPDKPPMLSEPNILVTRRF